MRVLITGAAGFIGSHVARALLERGDEVIGLDNFNPYYDPTLKERRSERLRSYPRFRLIRGDIGDEAVLGRAFADLGGGADARVCHLAAQAGVRHSIEHPDEFIRDNIVGFSKVIEHAKVGAVGGFIYASTSAVYGDNTDPVLSEASSTDAQISLYGMTKKANELHAGVYHSLFGMRTTGLRFFTVYGPWGRPDMALFLFTEAILKGTTMNIFGHGKMRRDFTYVDDICAGVVAALDRNHDNEIINLGGGHTEELMDFVQLIEQACGREGKKEFLPMQPGDIRQTAADVAKARRLLDYRPATRIADGVPAFVAWYREYYGR